MLQQRNSLTARSQYTFSHEIWSELEEMCFSQPKFCWMLKPLSTWSDLSDICYNLLEQDSLFSSWNVGGTVRSSVPFVLYPNKKCSGLSPTSPSQKSAVVGDCCSVPGHVGGIPHASPILDKEGHNNMVFQQDGAPPLYFHIALLGSKFSTEKDWQRQSCRLFTTYL